MSMNSFLGYANYLWRGVDPTRSKPLDDETAKRFLANAVNKAIFEFDIKEDVLTRYRNGEIDEWDAARLLEDEAGLSTKEARKHVTLSRTFSKLERDIEESERKRKKSKYHGAGVNNTFDESPTGVGSVGGMSVVAASLLQGEKLKDHPSVRYLSVVNFQEPENQHYLKCSLSGSLDTFLLQNYLTGLGQPNPITNIKDVGDSGRVVLLFDSESGHSTEVDLGETLETGYVVQSLNDELGLFPEGTVVGDLIDLDIVQKIVRSQGERDRVSDIERVINTGYKGRNDEGYGVLSGFKERVVSSISISPAYWISPDGEILSSVSTHIRAVCDNPKAFGLTEEYLKKAFAKYKEPWSSEGKARHEIMNSLLLKGWIRIRYTPRNDRYSIELNNLSGSNKGFLWDWASALVEANISKNYSEVYIVELDKNNNEVLGSIEELVSYRLFSSVGVVEGTLIPIKSVFEFGSRK